MLCLRIHRIPRRVIAFGITLCLAVGFFCIAKAEGADNANRIKPWGNNPRYWSYNGKPVLLLGGSDEDNLFNNPDLMAKNFETLASIGGNYIRGTLSCRDEGNVWPYEKTDKGYDLNRFNPEFWTRLETCFREAQDRGIIVQIEVWATFDYYRDIWLRNPFNPSQNVNYTTESTKLVPEWNFHPAAKRNAFFFSIPEKNNDTVLLDYQRAFVQKVLDTALPYPNILYCLDNETKAPQEWGLYWGRFIRETAAQRGAEVHITEMWDDWDIRADRHKQTYTHPDVYSFTDVSQNNWQVGQNHYDRLIWYRNMLVDQPGGIRPMNNVKVYMRQGGNKPNSAEINIDRWWQNIFAGCASTRFHRPTGGIGLAEEAQTTIRAARRFTDSFDIFATEPHPDLLTEREDNEAYCLANPGKTYALYFPKGGEVRLKTVPRDKEHRIRWFNPVSAEFISDTTIKGESESILLKSPDHNQIWLALIDTKD